MSAIGRDNLDVYLTKNLLDAPSFLSNNNNPFLVSPYTPVASIVTKSELSSITIIVSSIVINLSTVFDFTTKTLKISTITNSAGDNSVTISTTNINLDGTDININANDTTITGNVYFSNNTFFSSINASSISGKNILFSTLT